MTKDEIRVMCLRAQKQFLTWAAEAHHGPAHQIKWFRMAILAGVNREKPPPGFEDLNPGALRALSNDELHHYYKKHGRNKRWTYALQWYREYCSAEQSRQAQYKKTIPTLDELERRERLEKERHERQPGSPEWRKARFESQITDDLPEWTEEEATQYFRSKGHRYFSAPRRSENGNRYWIDFEMCDDGNERQVDKPVAKYVESKPGQRRVTVPNDMAAAIEAGDWATVIRLAGEMG